MDTVVLPPEVGSAVHPVLRGTSGYTMEGSQVILTVDEIANPRPNDDISGTLSLELWALGTPYAGGDFTGWALGSARLGELFGQNFWGKSRYPSANTEPPAGTWFLTLMLREWTEMGLVTRDFVNFQIPFVQGEAPVSGQTGMSAPAPESAVPIEFAKAPSGWRKWLALLRSRLSRS